MIVNDSTQAAAQQALDYIIQYPERHNQKMYFGYSRGHFDYGRGHDMVSIQTFNPGDAELCDTRMCIAGTVMWQQEGHIDTRVVQSVAGDALGLSGDEAMELFHTYDNETAVDALTAIANGDADKFYSILEI